MPSLRGYTTFYRGTTTLQHYYCTESAIKHLSLYGRLSLYDIDTNTTIIRKACNIFVIPADTEHILTNNRPWSYRSAFLHEIYTILSTIPPHQPLHVDFNNYPELFI